MSSIENPFAELAHDEIQEKITSDPIMREVVGGLMNRSMVAVQKFMMDNQDDPDILFFSMANMLHSAMGMITGTMNPLEIDQHFEHLADKREAILSQYEGLSVADAMYLLFLQTGLVATHAMLAEIMAKKNEVAKADSNKEE